MAEIFSFSEKPVLALMERIPAILPGVEKVTSIFYDPGSEKLLSCTMHKNDDAYLKETGSLSDPHKTLGKYRSDSSPYSWIREDEIDFEINTKEKVQLNIFNELDNNILIVRLHNDHDNLSDLFFIHFNKNLSNFGVSTDNSFLTTGNKTIIGHLLRNTLTTFLQAIKSDREIFITLLEHQNHVIKEFEFLQKELVSAKNKEMDALVEVCRNYLDEMSRAGETHYVLTEDSMEKIREFEGEPKSLKNIIARAARFARMASMKEDGDEIMIAGHHIMFAIPEMKPAAVSQSPERDDIQEVPARYARTFNFLNKLESAAQSVKGQNQLLTSANVGNAFPSPITPAAITDALKNHQSKILYLFKELPHRWLIIRSEFRPVQNILTPKSERQKRAG